MYGYIYKIENLVNGKVYIGQTVQKPEMRRYRHFYQLRNNKHRNSHLQNSFNKYGEDHFKFSIICRFNNEEELNKAETYYINTYNAFNSKHGYNLQSGGSNGKHAEETKMKISEFNKGKIFSFEHRRKLSETHSKKCKGLFGFPGASLRKRSKPENNPWNSQISYKRKTKSLGMYPDPLSASIVYKLVQNEIF